MLKTMAIEAGFDKTKNISNHSARKHLVQKLRDSNIAPTEIMQITGHKNVQSIINYSEISEQTQKKMFKPFSIMFYCNSISGICFMHFCQRFRNEHFSPHPPCTSTASWPKSNTWHVFWSCT